MHWDPADTIAAIASPPTGALRGIVRLSGPRVVQSLDQRFVADTNESLESMQKPTAVSGRLELPELHSPLPCTIYYWPGPRSYTRQSVLEIHTYGSPPLLECLLRTLCAAGARPAEPGEFTMRAFLAGRLDLTQAEAVLGLIDAHSRAGFETALKQMAGGISGPLGALRERLLDLLAHLEAGLDFVEEDIEFISAQELLAQLGSAAAAIEELLGQMSARGQARELARVVLYGWPNVGKSSLLNCLTGAQQALVSPVGGTTRDYLSVELDLAGLPCQIIDTAGMEPSDDSASISIAAAAQRLGGQQRKEADVRILCLDFTRPLNPWERQELARQDDGLRLVVLTKCDLPRRIDEDDRLTSAVATSALSGAGIDTLRTRLRKTLVAVREDDQATVASTAARCHDSLRLAAESLRRATEAVACGHREELVAAEVRVALTELGKIVGAIYTEDVLDRIFSRFCIGK